MDKATIPPAAAQSSESSEVLSRVLAALSLATTVILTARLWSLVAAQQAIWALPGLYFLGLIGIPTLTAILVFARHESMTRATFGATGGVFAFSILGAWTIGLFYPLAGRPSLGTCLRDSRRHP